VSAKKIRIPAGVVREISGAAMAPARSIASSLVGLAVVAFVFGVAALVLLVLFAFGLVSPWLACAVPTCSACGLAVVSAGVALDVLREIRGAGK
jgi:ABC-type microcin C transport system permease subunit YejB